MAPSLGRRDRLVQHLIDESVGLKKIKQPKMISIMGIRGSGKTALATEVHERRQTSNA